MDNIHIRGATDAEDAVIARHFFQLWQDNAVPKTVIQENWLEITLEFILHARAGFVEMLWIDPVLFQLSTLDKSEGQMG
jgi:hypothetical protein